jgi:hypothetical protein
LLDDEDRRVGQGERRFECYQLARRHECRLQLHTACDGPFDDERAFAEEDLAAPAVLGVGQLQVVGEARIVRVVDVLDLQR